MSDNKKSYVQKKIDYVSLILSGILYSIGLSLLMRIICKLFNFNNFELSYIPLSILFLFFVIIIVVLISKLFNFWLVELIIYFKLKSIKINKPANTVIIIGQINFNKISYWITPNYDLDLLLIINYLRLKNTDFSIYRNVTVNILDAIMLNRKIKNVYLLGHGMRHGFKIDSDIILNYCRYDNTKYKKDYVYQIHCNNGYGKSLVEYVVPKKNQKDCLPEHGYMSNITIQHMFMDKIIDIEENHKSKILLKFKYILLPYFLWIFSFIICVLFLIWIF
ncbi:MAG: hypothetical protein WCY27_04085 [archaeon]|nr:hypothetical protein [Candidatus ainarchaeum sp.]